jgi:uncharacterized protein YgiB involved in biofilm formation
MHAPPVKTLIVLLLLLLGGAALFFKFRRIPACSEGGKYMSTISECQSWGVNAELCKEAVAKARDVAARAAPKSETSLQCETRFSDCFEAPGGGFVPRPSFCLNPEATGSQPSEIRYLEYESDRMNRRKTREVRID